MTLLHEFFDATSARFPARIALRYREGDHTYAELRDRSLRVAAGLAALGVGRGDRVVIYLQIDRNWWRLHWPAAGSAPSSCRPIRC